MVGMVRKQVAVCHRAIELLAARASTAADKPGTDGGAAQAASAAVMATASHAITLCEAASAQVRREAREAAAAAERAALFPSLREVHRPPEPLRPTLSAQLEQPVMGAAEPVSAVVEPEAMPPGQAATAQEAAPEESLLGTSPSGMCLRSLA